MGSGYIYHFISARFRVYLSLSRLETKTVSRRYHPLAVRSIMSPTNDNLAIPASYRLLNDIKVRDASFRTVDNVNPAVFDIQVVSNVDPHLGGSKLHNLTLGISRCHLDGIAVHECFPAAPGTEVSGTDTGISGMYPDIFKAYPQLFGTNPA